MYGYNIALRNNITLTQIFTPNINQKINSTSK